ncbi:MAG: glycosyltransferase family 2 protein [Methylococcaceae bacterium]
MNVANSPLSARKNKICLVTSVRNEGVHLAEWIAYHLLIGVTHFLVFSNDCDDGTDELLGKFHQAGIITHVPQEILPSEKPQVKSFQRAWNEFLPAIAPDYVYVADPDEFLNLKCFDSIDQLLNYYDYPEALAIQWRHFGSSGRFFREPRLTVERFVYASLSDNWHNRQIKTISRYEPTAVKALAAHRPVFKKPEAKRRYILPGICRGGVTLPQEVVQGANAKRMPGHFPIMQSIAQVNHYATRSIEEFNVKKNRGNGVLVNTMKAALHFRDDYFMEHDLNDVVDTSLLRRLSELVIEYDNLVERLQLDTLITRMESLFADKVIMTPEDRIERENYILIPEPPGTQADGGFVFSRETLPARIAEDAQAFFSGELLIADGCSQLEELQLLTATGRCLPAILEKHPGRILFRFARSDIDETTLWITARFNDDSQKTLARLYRNPTP